jgi:hypothetical protein
VQITPPLGQSVSASSDSTTSRSLPGSLEFVGPFEDKGWKLAGTMVPIAWRTKPTSWLTG